MPDTNVLTWLLEHIRSEFVSAPRRPGGGGGRYSNRYWTETKLVGFSPATLRRLNKIADYLTSKVNHKVYPMQVAAMLVERAVAKVAIKKTRKQP